MINNTVTWKNHIEMIIPKQMWFRRRKNQRMTQVKMFIHFRLT